MITYMVTYQKPTVIKASISLDMNQSAGGSWAANTSTPENLSFDTSNTHEYIFERFNEGQTDQISHLKKKKLSQ